MNMFTSSFRSVLSKQCMYISSTRLGLFLSTGVLTSTMLASQVASAEEAEKENSSEIEHKNIIKTFPMGRDYDIDALSPLGKFKYERNCKKCKKFKKKSLEYHTVNFMIDALQRKGCPINPEKFVECHHCDSDIKLSGATIEDEDGPFGIALCQNVVSSQKHVNHVLTHELIHLYDSCTAHVEHSNCRHHACTEVRASNLSGDCLWSSEMKRGNPGVWANKHNVCVRRRALLSVKANPYCQEPGRAEKAVDDVFDRCVRDVEPFGSVPF